MIDTLAALLAEQRAELDNKSQCEYALSFYCQMMGALIPRRAVREADPGLARLSLQLDKRTCQICGI